MTCVMDIDHCVSLCRDEIIAVSVCEVSFVM